MSGLKQCVECGRAAERLRRKRCDACYMRLYRGGDLPQAACCAVCGERRRHVLLWADLAETQCVLCGNCALVNERMRPRAMSVALLAQRVRRERRMLTDRRQQVVPVALDRRIGPRRQLERMEQLADVGTAARGFDPALD